MGAAVDTRLIDHIGRQWERFVHSQLSMRFKMKPAGVHSRITFVFPCSQYVRAVLKVKRVRS